METTQSDVRLAGGLRLAVRTAGTGGRSFLLVHGLASNSRLWDAVADRLSDAGHTAIAVDLRGHGLSDEPAGGYDTDTCADDLAGLIAVLGLESPIVAGQSWGGNVVLSLAARHPGVAAAVCCVDGGWIRPAGHFASFADTWEVLEPPDMSEWRWDDIERRIRAAMGDWPGDATGAALANLRRLPDGGVRARLAREHHKEIVRSLYDADPREWMKAIQVPVLLGPAVGPIQEPGESERLASTRAAVHEALALLPAGDVHWFAGAHHDLHAQRADVLAGALLTLAEGAQ